MSEQNHGEASPSRRRLLKAGVATTGAAYIAPQILNTAVAGAQTSSCYVMKFEGSGSSGLTGPSWDNSDKCGTFNAAITNSFMGTLQSGVAPGTTVSPGPAGGEVDTVVQIPTGCEFRLVGWKSATAFFWKTNTTSGLADNAASSKANCESESVTSESIVFDLAAAGGPTATIKPNQGVSHVTLVICCTGSPIAP